MKIEKAFNQYRDKNGYIDLTDEANLLRLEKKYYINHKNLMYVLIDKESKARYMIKISQFSGGDDLPHKEVYESLISRLVSSFSPSVVYEPVLYKGLEGVIMEDWSNDCSYKSILDTFSYQTLITSAVDLESNSDILATKLSKNVIKHLHKYPQHIMAGNMDYKISNVAVGNKLLGKYNKILNYDYGFSIYSLIEKTLLNKNIPATSKNIKTVFRNIWENHYSCIIGLGINENISLYNSFNDFTDNINDNLLENKSRLFHNIKEAVSKLSENTFSDEIIRMQDKNIKITSDMYNIIMTTRDIYEKSFNDAINNN